MIKAFTFENNFNTFGDIIDDMTRMLSGGCQSSDGAIKPDHYLTSDDAGAKLFVELPGVAKTDISCSTDGDKFDLSASREKLGKKVEYSLKLKFRSDFDLDVASVAYSDGLLTVTVPFKENAKPRKLDIA